MKLKASVDRGAAKRATDLLDIVRLVTDPATADLVLTELESADGQLRRDAALHADLQFRTNSLATRRLLNELRQPGLDDDLISAAGDFLQGALS